jgi:hypothetical protein
LNTPLPTKNELKELVGYLTPLERAQLDALLISSNEPLGDLSLPDPYDLQLEIMRHPAKRKVICAGRRVGKTIMCGLLAAEYMMNSKRVLLSSTSQDQSDAFWEYITGWFYPLIESRAVYKNEVKRLLRYNGGQIRVKTGRHPNTLRSGWCDLLVLDECAYLDADAWNKVGAPMLADTNGTAIFISTPKRRNWFFQLYQQAIADTSGRWAAWNFSTHKNPHLSEDAMDSLVADMTEEDYQQEILAQFLEGQGAVFRYIDERATLELHEPREPYEGSFVFGVDWAQQKDFTVIAVMDTESRQLVDYDRFNGVNWSLQRGRLQTLYEKWKPDTIIAESNSVGSPNIEALQQSGLPVVSFETTAASKPPLIESLVLAFDRNEIAILNDPIIKGELMAYERKITATGRSQYSAPEGMHDDCVMALALAWHGCVQLPTWSAFTI